LLTNALKAARKLARPLADRKKAAADVACSWVRATTKRVRCSSSASNRRCPSQTR